MNEENTQEQPFARKRAPLKWKSSKKGLPLPVKGIAKELELGLSRVYDIVAGGQLPAFIYNEAGTELIPYETTGSRPVTGQSIYAYSEDVAKLKKLRAEKANVRGGPKPPPEITEEQRNAVVAEAEKQMQEKGYVSRRDILANLRWHSTKYPIVRYICDEHKEEWPMMHPGMSQYK